MARGFQPHSCSPIQWSYNPFQPFPSLLLDMMSKSGTAHVYAPLSRCERGVDENESEASLLTQRPSRRKSPSNFVCLFIALLVSCFALGILSWRTSYRAIPRLPSCKNTTVRHEWRSLSRSEQHGYLQAVQCLRNVPSRLGLNQTLYDDFSYVHTRTGDDGKWCSMPYSYECVKMVNST